jgi:hypothetical protein
MVAKEAPAPEEDRDHLAEMDPTVLKERGDRRDKMDPLVSLGNQEVTADKAPQEVEVLRESPERGGMGDHPEIEVCQEGQDRLEALVNQGHLVHKATQVAQDSKVIEALLDPQDHVVEMEFLVLLD